MKKHLLLLAVLAAIISIKAKAQQILLDENFDLYPGYNITQWSHIYATNGNFWKCGEPYLIASSSFTPPGNMTPYGKVAGVYDGGLLPDNANTFMYSSNINFSNVSGAWLKFDSYFLKASSSNGKKESARVEIATNSGATNWSLLKEVPAYSYGFKTYYINLSAYDSLSNIHIGFRYSDSGENMRGWLIDNIQVFVPFNKDLKLTKITPADTMLHYGRVNDFMWLGGQIFNTGIDTVYSFVVNYQAGNGVVVADTFTGVIIPPFTYYDFNHQVPYTPLTLGAVNLKMWTELTGDVNHLNDTLSTKITGVPFRPVKRLAIEEGTATWNKWGPRGIVYMHRLDSLMKVTDADACLISVHDDQDPMVVHDYMNYLYFLDYNYEPYFLFDRRLNVPPDSFFNYYQIQKQYFGFAKMDVTATMNDNDVKVSARITPAVDLKGDYRLAIIVTEDGVHVDQPAYNQNNCYAGGLYGPMGGYENKAALVPASQMVYDYVARQATPSPEGLPGVLPANMFTNQQYDVDINLPLNTLWNNSNLKINALLVRMSDSTVLNSYHTNLPLSIASVAGPVNTLNLFPNPATTETNLHFDLKKAETVNITVTDITGRKLYDNNAGVMSSGEHQLTIPTTSFNAGIYIMSLKTPSGKETIKLEVL